MTLMHTMTLQKCFDQNMLKVSVCTFKSIIAVIAEWLVNVRAGALISVESMNTYTIYPCTNKAHNEHTIYERLGVRGFYSTFYGRTQRFFWIVLILLYPGGGWEGLRVYSHVF